MESFEDKLKYQKYIEDENNALLSTDEQIEINNLRRKQTEEDFTPEEKERFMELREKENQQREKNRDQYNQDEENKKEKITLTEDEQSELKNLRRKQIDEEFTPEERERFMELQEKEDQSKIV